MMEMAYAIEVLRDISLELSHSPQYDLTPWTNDENIEAVDLAIRILSALDGNRAKAEEIIAVGKICRNGDLENCESCPYHMQGCTFEMWQDSERMLRLAYLQGGESDDQR